MRPSGYSTSWCAIYSMVKHCCQVHNMAGCLNILPNQSLDSQGRKKLFLSESYVCSIVQSCVCIRTSSSLYSELCDMLYSSE